MSKLHDIFIDHYGEELLAPNSDIMEGQIKELVLEAVGNDWPTAGYSHAVSREDKKAWLVNDVLAKIRQRVEEL